MAELVGCGTPCLLGNLGVREVVGSRVRRVFHPTRKLVRFSLLKCPSIPNSEICSPLMRHPATLITTPIPAN